MGVVLWLVSFFTGGKIKDKAGSIFVLLAVAAVLFAIWWAFHAVAKLTDLENKLKQANGDTAAASSAFSAYKVEVKRVEHVDSSVVSAVSVNHSVRGEIDNAIDNLFTSSSKASSSSSSSDMLVSSRASSRSSASASSAFASSVARAEFVGPDWVCLHDESAKPRMPAVDHTGQVQAGQPTLEDRLRIDCVDRNDPVSLKRVLKVVNENYTMYYDLQAKYQGLYDICVAPPKEKK